MTKAQLVDLLEGYDDDQEVRIMSQENWPFENAIAGVIAADDIGDDDEGSCQCSGRLHQAGCEAAGDPIERGYISPVKSANGKPAIYIAEGRQLCYGSKGAWE